MELGGVRCWILLAVFTIASVQVEGWNWLKWLKKFNKEQQRFDRDSCDRDCALDPTPRVCRFKMTLETYTTMSRPCYACPAVIEDCYRRHCIPADGFERVVYSVNRQLPGPQIRVCEDDTVKIKVTNIMADGEATSIHWHGMHQVDTCYMDGTAHVTEEGIPFLGSYVYEFVASPAGTHFYHSHEGSQRGEGMAGALIVKEKAPRFPLAHDGPEHTIVVQDWYDNMAQGEIMANLHNKGLPVPEAIIVNGRSPLNSNSSVKNPTYGDLSYSTINVQPGDSYRFRIINNAVISCPVQVYVQNHKMLVVSTDGAEIQEVEADSFVISGGERYDFILNTTENVDNYWMTFQGVSNCMFAPPTPVILHYDGASDVNPADMINPRLLINGGLSVVNPFNQGMVTPDSTDNFIILDDLKSDEPTPMWLSAWRAPDVKHYVELELHLVEDHSYATDRMDPCLQDDNEGAECAMLAQINFVSGKLPELPYLTNPDDVRPVDLLELGDPVTRKDCTVEYCQYVHRLRVELGDVVELILVDRGKHMNISHHPFHLHGQYFHVLAVGQDPVMITSKEDVERWDENGEIHRNYDHPIKKDTAMVPNGGYAVIRFKADNPGAWLFHCHNELDVTAGMFLIVHAGDPSTWTLPPTHH